MRETVDKILLVVLLFFLVSAWSACKVKDTPETPPTGQKPDTIGSTLATVNSDVLIISRGKKINQITGEIDLERKVPVLSQTKSRYKLEGTDLGMPVLDSDGKRTWVFFGDTWGSNNPYLTDALGYTDQWDPENGIKLDFVSANGTWKPIFIDGINQGGFEVPAEAIMIGETMYLYHTTDHTRTKTMSRSVLAKANRQQLNSATFKLMYNFSIDKFINMSIERVKNADWALIPQNAEESILIFGSGDYRNSPVYLAYQPVNGIESKSTLRYFGGVRNRKAVWITDEKRALPIVNFETTPRVGELSVSYNKFLKRWILLYNHDSPRGINMRTAEFPWGPWSNPQVLFRPWEDKGYCYFIHTSWDLRNCDNVMEPASRTHEWGGEYAPYQYRHWAKGDEAAGNTTIYFNMSTWNPYQVVLMEAKLYRLQ